MSLVGKTFASYFKDLFHIGNSNSGVDATTRNVKDGLGNSTSISLSDDVLSVQPVNGNSTGTLLCKTDGGDNILAVDTQNYKVKVGSSQVNATTMIKEMGLYDFSPSVAGYHYPLIANTMFVPTGATAFAADNDWGNGTDPATTLDVSGLTAPANAIAVYWYLQNNITLDEVRYLATADASDALTLHLFAYTIDTSTNHGDLSTGVVHANASVSATSTTIKTGTFTLDKANIDANKVVIGFVESDSTTDLSVAFQIKYHIR